MNHLKKTKQDLYQEREKRVMDAVALKIPDRVPVTSHFSFFSARYCGITVKEMMYDPDKAWEAQLKTTLDFQPDMAQDVFGGRMVGAFLDILDFRQMQWAGRQLDDDAPYQFVENEYMKADEYDHFLSDMSDFVLRKYWPRISGALKGLEKLPSFRNVFSYSRAMPAFAAFSLPEVREALDALKRAGDESARVASYARRFNEKLKEEGFPLQGGGGASAPFDVLGDFFRGTKGLMLDMYRRPDMVLQTCEKLLPMILEAAVNSAKRSGNPRIFIPLHKGLDGFMSPDQFNRFYWPTLKELMIELINEGLNPWVFWEGDATSRLEIIKDIPAGKAVYSFEATDIMKAKDILGDRICIRGNVPISVLATGTPEDVQACCKKLIDYVGRNGGYIMDSSAGLDDAKTENVRAMFDFTREYGVY
jgi:uroporphyrinogen-III decarboxylase